MRLELRCGRSYSYWDLVRLIFRQNEEFLREFVRGPDRLPLVRQIASALIRSPYLERRVVRGRVRYRPVCPEEGEMSIEVTISTGTFEFPTEYKADMITAVFEFLVAEEWKGYVVWYSGSKYTTRREIDVYVYVPIFLSETDKEMTVYDALRLAFEDKYGEIGFDVASRWWHGFTYEAVGPTGRFDREEKIRGYRAEYYKSKEGRVPTLLDFWSGEV